MNYKQYDLDHLKSMRSWNIIQSRMDISPEMQNYLQRTREEIETEIRNRLQLTLFPEEPNDWAYAD